MTFLNPAILFGLIAASIPLLIHLLNLKKLEKVEFSTLAFLKELQRTKIRRIKIKQWILLAVRMLAVALLVLAFARPTLKSITLGDSTSAAKTTAIIIIDNSISMSIVNERGSYFNQAKEKIKKLLYNFNSGDNVYIINTSELFNLPQTGPVNLTAAEKIVDNINLSDASGKIETALDYAYVLLSKSQNFNKEIYLFGDLQKSMLSNPNLQNKSNDLPDIPAVRLFVFKYGDRDIANLSLTELTVNNQIFEPGRPITFTSVINNFSSRHINNEVVSLFINGTRRAQQSIDLAPNDSKRLSFGTTLDEIGLIEIFAEIDDDEMPLDNKRYLTVFVPDKISLLLCSEKISDAVFIRTALERSSVKNVEIDFKKPEHVSTLMTADYDVIILIGGEDKIDPEKFEACFQKGGKIILFPGKDSSINGLSNLFNRIGLQKPQTFVESITATTGFNKFDAIDFKHPIFSDLFEKNFQPEIESPDIYKYVKHKPGSGRTIISLLDGSSFLTEYKIGNGELFFFNFAPVLSWSNFPLKGLFAPLITKSVYYLSSKTSDVKSQIAGEQILINSEGVFLPQIEVILPNKNRDFINLETTNKKFYSYFNTGTAGIYKFYSGNRLIDYASANFDQAESSFNYLTENEFEKFLDEKHFAGENYIINPDDNFESVIYNSRFGTELWKYFLLAAFLLLIIEMLIARNTKKEIVSINNSIT